MELYNLIVKETGNEEVHTIGYVYLLQALYPFVPHMTSEIWSKMPMSISEKLVL
jgi:leucyl-tRNA synthetase